MSVRRSSQIYKALASPLTAIAVLVVLLLDSALLPSSTRVGQVWKSLSIRRTEPALRSINLNAAKREDVWVLYGGMPLKEDLTSGATIVDVNLFEFRQSMPLWDVGFEHLGLSVTGMEIWPKPGLVTVNSLGSFSRGQSRLQDVVAAWCEQNWGDDGRRIAGHLLAGDAFYTSIHWDGIAHNAVAFVVAATLLLSVGCNVHRWLMMRTSWGRRRRGCCGVCGYDLGGLMRAIACPECGAARLE